MQACVRMLAGAVIAVVASLSSPHPAAHARDGRPPCLPGCDLKDASSLSDCCEACLEGPCDRLELCLDHLRDDFQDCVADCPTFAGRCTITRECVQRCRARSTSGRSSCVVELKRGIQRGCSEGRLACRIGRRGAGRVCRACGAATTTTATTLMGLEAVGKEEDPFGCQRRCVEEIAGSCYEDCNDRCEGDQLALALCREGCRNAQCRLLQRACTENDRRAASRYRLCCISHDGCLDTVDCVIITTTTTTTRASTTTRTTASATTTLPR